MSEEKSPPDALAENEAGAGRIAGPELEIKDAPLIFERVWKQLVQERGLEGMAFPKEIMWLGGAPGSGKGTNTPFILRERGLTAPPIVVSDLLDTPGMRALKDRGQFVGDREVIEALLRKLLEPTYQTGVVVDGFPRTKVQAEALDAALAEAGRRVDLAGYIDVPLEDLVRRMANRRICTANGHVYNLASNPPRVDSICDLDGSPIVQRPDDDEATVRARMQEQIPPLLEVVDHYRTAGVLQTVDGREPISDVSERVLAAIDSPTVVDVPAGSVEPA